MCCQWAGNSGWIVSWREVPCSLQQIGEGNRASDTLGWKWLTTAFPERHAGSNWNLKSGYIPSCLRSLIPAVRLLRLVLVFVFRHQPTLWPEGSLAFPCPE